MSLIHTYFEVCPLGPILMVPGGHELWAGLWQDLDRKIRGWEGIPRGAEAQRQDPGCVVLAPWASSQGLQEAVAHRLGLLRQQAPVRLHAPGRRQLSGVKSKRRKFRHSTHTHQNWTGLVCLEGPVC